MDKKKEKLVIAGVNVALDRIDTDKVKNLDDVKALDIFSHLEGKAKTDAEKELAGKLGVKLKEDKPAPQQP